MSFFPEREEPVSPELFPAISLPTVPANLEEIASQVALVNQNHDGGDFNDLTAEAASYIGAYGVDDARRKIADKEHKMDFSAADRALRRETSQDTLDYYKSVLQKHEGPPNKQALEAAVVDIVTPKTGNYWVDTNRQSLTKDLAARNILQETMADASQNATFWQHVLSFGRALIPFAQDRAIARAVGDALGKDAGFTDYFNTHNIENEFRSAFLNASPERRVELAQALRHGVEKYSSFFGDKNSAEVIANLSRIIDGRAGDAAISTLFNVGSLPLATTAKILAAGARMASEAGIPARVALMAGNKDLAASLMAKDALTGSKISGMATEDIARKATSFNVTPLELQAEELGISQPLQEKLRGFASGLREQIKKTLLPKGASEAEITDAYNFYMEKHSSVRDKRIYEYTPQEFDNLTGEIIAEIKWQNPDGQPFRSYAAAKQFGVENNKVGYATLLEPKVVSENPAVFRSNRINKKYITEDMPESEYLGRQVKFDENGKPYFETSPTPSWGATLPVEEKWVFVEKATQQIPQDVKGTYSLSDILGRNFFNAHIPMFAGSIEDVSNRGLGMSANAKVRKDLEMAYKEAITGAPKKDLDKAMQMLRKGDALSNAAGAQGHVYSELELSAEGLNTKAIEAYYKLRLLRDTGWLLRNKTWAAEMRAQGMMEMAFDGNATVGAMNRPAAPVRQESIKSLISNGRIGKVLDTKDGRVFHINHDDVDNIYGAGGQVVRLYKPEVINGRQYTHLVVHPDDVHFTEIHTPLPFRPGEFARVHTDEYFVRMTYETVDEFDNIIPAGGAGGAGETIRTAPSLKAGKEFIEAMNKAMAIINEKPINIWGAAFAQRGNQLSRLEAIIGKYMNPEDLMKEVESGKIPRGAKFDIHYDRETHSYLADAADESITNGRLFYSKRGEKLLSTDPTRENTLSVTESLGVELANIARFITSKDIRVDAIERWMKTFGDGIVNRTFNNMMDFTEGKLNADAIKKALERNGSELSQAESAQLLKFAESSRDYIKKSLNLKTQEDKLSIERNRRVSEFVEKVVGKAFGDKAAIIVGPALRKASVSDFLRTVNFHAVLGMFNPSQLLVQANGMFVAVGIHPILGPGSAKTAILLRMALMSDNPKVWEHLASLDNITSLGLKNVNDFKQSVEAIRKSGILADIRSTALYNIEDGALNLYKNEFKNAFNVVSPFWFNRGEEMSRLTSWEIARREWKGRNLGKDWNTEEALREISIRQKEFNLGMQSYNTAGWQKGWAGIPTQFLQYNVKLATALVHTFAEAAKTGFKGPYRGFTPAQASRLLATQLILYGAAGNGLLWGLDKALGTGDEKLTEEQRAYIAEGAISGLLYSATQALDGEPAKLALGTRLGSFNWYEQLYEKIVSDESGISDILFGVTKSTGVKAYDNVANLARLFTRPEAVTPELVMNELGRMPEVISSWSNATKAYFYMQHEGYVTSKDGTPIARINTKENLAAFLGLSSIQVQEYYRNAKGRTQFNAEIKEIAASIYRLRLQEWEAYNKGDIKLANDLRNMSAALLYQAGDTGKERLISQQVRRRFWPGDTASDKLRREFLEATPTGQATFNVIQQKRQ